MADLEHEAAPPPPSTTLPRSRKALPGSLRELGDRLAQAGIEAFIQGEAGLDAWLGTCSSRRPTQTLVCLADPAAILAALPNAVVTAERAQRITQASPDGPIDLIAASTRAIDAVLLGFGLAPLALAWRPSGERTCDPGRIEAALERGELPLIPGAPNPFLAAPRRYWIAAQLIAEYDLTPSDAFIGSAREALPQIGGRMPEGAPVRRALARVLACPMPSRALRFLRETGALGRLLAEAEAGASASGDLDARIDALPAGSALRWAALLRGPSTGEALARLRMPQAVARSVLRLNEAHPLDVSNAGARDPQVRRLLSRFRADELEALLAWRRLELDGESNTDPASDAESARGAPHALTASRRRPTPREVELARTRLARLEAAIARVQAQIAASESVRALALGGAEVMHILGAGPGRAVGRALTHLAAFVAANPERNTVLQLEAELRAWQRAGGEAPVR